MNLSGGPLAQSPPKNQQIGEKKHMKKAIFTTLVTLAFASTAFAAVPTANVEAGQLHLGYANYNLKTEGNLLGDLGSFKANNYQAAYGLSDKISLTGDYLSSEKHSFYNSYYGYYTNLNYSTTQLGLQYKLTNNLALSVGNVKAEFSSNEHANSTNEVYGGISYNAVLTNNLNGYASYLKSKNVQDAKVGVQYTVSPNVSVDVNYRDYQDSNSGMKAKGVGVGANYKF